MPGGKIVGDGSADATRKIGRQGAPGMAAHGITEKLPAFPAVGKRVVVLHPPQQELGFVGRKRAIHHRGQPLAVEFTDIGVAGGVGIGSVGQSSHVCSMSET